MTHQQQYGLDMKKKFTMQRAMIRLIKKTEREMEDERNSVVKKEV